MIEHTDVCFNEMIYSVIHMKTGFRRTINAQSNS